MKLLVSNADYSRSGVRASMVRLFCVLAAASVVWMLAAAPAASPVWAAVDSSGSSESGSSNSGSSSTLTGTAVKQSPGAQKGCLSLDDPFEFESVQSMKLQGGSKYPDSFDLRNVDTDGDGTADRSFVTPVKVQNPFGTCWGFAATAVAESAILADDDLNEGLDAETFDLSEKHLAWFSASYIKDQSDPQYGEGTHFLNGDDDEAKTHYNTGGFEVYATLCYAAGIGPMPEARYPYSGKNEERANWRVATSYDEQGNPLSYKNRDVWYSDDDDWTISEDERYGNVYRLKESFVLPSPAAETDDGSYLYNEAGVEAVKEHLADHHRAVSVNFTAESYVPGQDTKGKRYMSSNWAHYTWRPASSNHAVTIVGWDDNYPKENFLEEHQPPHDGAFLIKNSWGSELNEFPNNGYRHWGLLEGLDGIPYDKDAKPESDRATGYFWISYYDQSLNGLETFDFDRPNDDNGYYVEQSDLMIQGRFGTFKEDGARAANVFTAEATSELSGLSVMTTTPGTTVDYEIYLLRGGYTGPTDGVMLASGTESYLYGGYHHIELKEAQRAVLAKGQDYSVIVTEKTPSGQNYAPVSLGFKKRSVFVEDMGFYNEAVINPGESFFYTEGSWVDVSDEAVQKSIIGMMYDDLGMDNFLIKTYLEPVEQGGGVFNGYLKVSNWSLGAPGTFTFREAGDPLLLSAEFRGTKAGDPEIEADFTWTSSDESIFTVEPKAGNSGQAVVTATGKIGIAYLIVDAGSYGRRVVGIECKVPEPDPGPITPTVVKASIKTLKVQGGRKLKVTVVDKTDTIITGYKISYRIKGKTKWKTTTLLAPATSKTLKKLKKGKKYQVRARCYLEFEGENYYGAWSKVKTSKKIK